MGRWRSCLVLILAAACGAGSAPADEAAPSDEAAQADAVVPARPVSEHSVVVPFDPGRKVGDQDPNQFFLDYPTFLRLWEAAKKTRAERGEQEDGAHHADEGEPQRILVSRALYRATADTDRVRVTAVLDVLTTGGDWFDVPLGFGAGVQIGALRVDGEAAAASDGGVLVRGAGSHRLEIDLEVPAPPGWESVSWEVPPAAAALVAATPGTAGDALEIGGAGGMMVAEDGTVTAALGGATTVTIKRSTRGESLLAGRVAVADFVVTAEVGKQLETFRWNGELEMAGAGLREMQFLVGGGVRLSGITVPGMQGWRVTQEDDGTLHIAVTLDGDATGKVPVEVVAERVADDALPAGRRLPTIDVPGADRLQTTAVLVAAGGLDVRAGQGGGIRRVAVAETPVGADAFRWSGRAATLDYSVLERGDERSATVGLVYQVSASKLETVVIADLRNASGVAEAAFPLAEGTAVDSVVGGDIEDWWVTDGAIKIRFVAGDDAGAESRKVVLALVRPLPALPDQLELPPVLPDGFEKVDGYGVLVAHVNVGATLALAGPPAARVAEIAADAALRRARTEVLPPLEAKRAFTFDAHGFTASAAFIEREPTFRARSVMHARAFDAWVGVSAIIDIEVEAASLDVLGFTVPAELPEFAVSGPEIREVSTAVEDGLRRYTVTFQREIVDATRLVLEGEIPHAGAVALPELGVDGTGRLERFFIVENASSGQLSVGADGAEPVGRELMPYLPADLGRADFYRGASGDAAVQLVVEDLESSSGAQVLVSLAELTSALRRNGEVWTRATYRMQNRSLQFLPVRLPEGATLVSVAVAGIPTRADIGSIDGELALLIPLIQTEPGQVAYTVDLVYRHPSDDASKSHTKLAAVLEDPELVGLTVERTLWAVYLPAGFALTDHDGNLRQVEGEQNTVERFRDLFAEASSLYALSRSESVDAETRLEAAENAYNLNDALTTAYAAAEKSGTKAQRGGQAAAWDTGELGELGRDLAEQQIIVTENRIEIARFAKDKQADLQEGAAADAESTRGWFANSSEIVQRDQVLDLEYQSQVERLQSHTAFNDNLLIDSDFVLEGAEPEDHSADPFSAADTDADAAQPQSLMTPNLRARAVQTRQLGQPLQAQAAAGVASTPAPANEATKLADRMSQERAFRAVGRVSLAVDFPLGGEPVHFQKLKGDARLEVEAKEARAGRPAWQWVLLGGGFVLVGLGFAIKQEGRGRR